MSEHLIEVYILGLQPHFAIFLVSTAFAALGSLITSTFPDPTTKTIFIVITVVGFFVGAYLLLSWYRNHTSLKSVCQRIRERIPPDIVVSPSADVDKFETEQSDLPKG